MQTLVDCLIRGFDERLSAPASVLVAQSWSCVLVDGVLLSARAVWEHVCSLCLRAVCVCVCV